MTTATRITYTSATGDLEEFHRQFGRGLALIRQGAGALHAFYIGGQAVESDQEPLVDRSPINTDLVLGRCPAVLRLEGVGLDWKGRLRALLRRAIHARTESYGDRGLT